MTKPRLFQSKNEQVYAYLREAILDSRIEPGAALVIDGLAADLGVSQIPIREALRQLEADGFVVIEPYVGARVTDLKAASIHEIFDLLEALEIISGRAACKTLNDADLNDLSGLIESMRGLMDDPDAWSEQNKQFHQAICERAQMHLVQLSLRRALDHWDRLRRRYLTEVFASRIKLAQQEHERLIAGLRERDADQVEAIVREHNRASLRAYIELLEAQGAF
ncbi:MAG TPA: GntR family transcriptional regulator [Phototrophicaceae bacterium]|nr:GntR family transcriptional regulator [Phototrophicaceae bacterium]